MNHRWNSTVWRSAPAVALGSLLLGACHMGGDIPAIYWEQFPRGSVQAARVLPDQAVDAPRHRGQGIVALPDDVPTPNSAELNGNAQDLDAWYNYAAPRDSSFRYGRFMLRSDEDTSDLRVFFLRECKTRGWSPIHPRFQAESGAWVNGFVKADEYLSVTLQPEAAGLAGKGATIELWLNPPSAPKNRQGAVQDPHWSQARD